MTHFYLCADTDDGTEKQDLAIIQKQLESAGHQTTMGSVGPNAESVRNNNRNYDTIVFMCNGGIAGATYWSFCVDYQEGMPFTIILFRHWKHPNNKTMTVDALRNQELVIEWDAGQFLTGSSRAKAEADIKGHTCCSYQKKYSNIIAFHSADSPEQAGKDIASNNLTCGSGGSMASNDTPTEDDGGDDEDAEDKDNFTPHKGHIMEIKPYKQISSVSFDKSYDSPTGSGTVEMIYNSADKNFIYKGVAMKLKLRRDCDQEWSATGLEEPGYEEHEKFFKEHIPTEELLEELGLKGLRDMKPSGTSPTTSTDGSTSPSSSSSSSSDDQSTSPNGSTKAKPKPKAYSKQYYKQIWEAWYGNAYAHNGTGKQAWIDRAYSKQTYYGTVAQNRNKRQRAIERQRYVSGVHRK